MARTYIEDGLQAAREILEARVACWCLHGVHYEEHIEPWRLAIRSRMATENREPEAVCGDMIRSRRDLLAILEIKAAALDVIEQEARKGGADGKLQ